MGAVPPLTAERKILHARSRHPKDAPAATRRECWPTEEEIAIVMKAIANAKAVGLDGLSIELLKLDFDKIGPSCWSSTRLITLIWRDGNVPQKWKDAIIIVLQKKGDKTEWGNYRSISLCHTRGMYPLWWMPGGLAITVRNGTLTGGAVQVLTGSLDHGHGVCVLQATGN